MSTVSSVTPEFLEEIYAIPGNKFALRYLIEELCGPVVILAGNGLTREAGFPTWPEFLERLSGVAGVESLPDDPIRTAAAIVDKAGPLLLFDSMEETYTELPWPLNQSQGALPVLPYLSDTVVTINRDNAIEEAYRRAGLSFAEKRSGDEDLSELRPAIWKLNGTIEKLKSLVVVRRAATAELVPRVTKFLHPRAALIVGVTQRDLFGIEIFAECLKEANTANYAIFTEPRSTDPAIFSRHFIRPIWCPGEHKMNLLMRYLAEQSESGIRIKPPIPLAPFEPTPAPARPTQTPSAPTALPSSSPATPPPELPQDLIDVCRAGECVLFAGAGLSARTQVPTWNVFLSNLIDFAEFHHITDAPHTASLRAALDEGARDAVADSVVQAFGTQRDLLLDFMRRSFPEPASLSPAHQYLQKIAFAAVVTTNYDRLLEVTFPDFAAAGLYTPKDAEALLDCLSQKRRFLLKLYGVIERPETLIFAPEEYRDLVASNVSYSKFIEGFFFSRSFFFIGLSLAGIQDFLSGFVFRGTSPRKHFALVPVAGRADQERAKQLLRRYNIQVIAIPVSQDFPEVDLFLEQLSLAAPVPVVPAAGAVPPSQAAVAQGIRRVILEDIGPFPKLELDFAKDKNWKILLGDNGVGKSTILKAIATAIIGSDARSYAGRLVRAGATRGRITLITEQNPSGYVTEIYTKDMTSEAEVISIPSRPMEAEGWLALGFSPLRVVTWIPSSGAQAMVQKGRPSADDLVPLLSGEPDPRMDRLKQWIVNLDNAEKTGQGVPQEFRTLTGHTKWVRSVAFSGDGRMLVSGSIDTTVRIWDLESGRQTAMSEKHSGGVNCVALSADGSRAISGSFDRMIRVWDTKTGRTVRILSGSRSQVMSLALTPDGKTLVTGTAGGSIRLWDVDSGKEARIIATGLGDVWSLSISADGAITASCSERGKLELRNTSTAAPTSMDEPGWAVALSPDGKTLVAGNRNNEVTVWDTGTGEKLRTLTGPAADIMAVALSADGNTIVSGSKDGTICVWEGAATSPTRTNRLHTDEIWSVALSPDGNTIASASNDRTIKLWTLNPPEPGPSPAQTISKFFQLIGTVTDRKDIDFLRVTENFRVLVTVADIADGVPMEVLSQGLTSLFGWIGVLCQRLKETLQNPTNDALPTNSFALVLIDELDAHMHPRWQQVLVHRLKKAFPNVQFIACTHSPLIVGGLSKDEVARFTLRNGQMVPVDFDPDMTLGRTDQVLAGELFGLPTTLDADTQDMMREYQELLGKSQRSAAEERSFQRLGAQLETRIPPAAVAPLERRARELLETLQSADLTPLDRADPPGEKGAVRNDIQDRMVRLSKLLAGEKVQ